MSGVSLAIRALLVPSPVTAAVGSRVYPYPLPSTTALPAIAIAMSAEDEEMLLQGASVYPQTVVQVHCVAGSAKDAIELGEKVRDHLRDLAYVSADVPPEHASFEKDAVDFTDFSDDLSTHRRVMSFNLRWRAEAP
jgi:hypothetical protein